MALFLKNLTMKRFKFLFVSILMALVSVSLFSCSSDDDNDNDIPKDAASVIVGNYPGTLRAVGYDNSDAVCYVTLERLANNAVRLSKLTCEKYEIDINPVNLKVEESSNGVYTLKSETSKMIEGMYNNKILTLTFGMGEITWSFTGKKE